MSYNTQAMILELVERNYLPDAKKSIEQSITFDVLAEKHQEKVESFKDAVITLGREDLRKGKEDLPANQISLHDFRSDSLPTYTYRMAAKILFLDGGQPIILKDRGNLNQKK